MIRDIEVGVCCGIKNRVSLSVVFSADWRCQGRMLSCLFYKWQCCFDESLGLKEAISLDSTSKINGLEWALFSVDESADAVI